MFNLERRAAIIKILEEQGKVEVAGLSRRFSISRETIRRDLAALEREGILVRTHGGAVYSREGGGRVYEYPVSIRGIQRYHEKNDICKFAASLICDGDTIFVDNSSTTVYLARHIPRGIKVTIVTNSIKLLMEAVRIPNPDLHYICLGGAFKESNLSLYGSATVRFGSEYYPGKSFMSCAGISPDGLVTDSSIQEVDTKRMMIEHSQEFYLLADYTKFSALGQVFLTRLSSGSRIITDRKANQNSLDAFTRAGVQFTVV